MLPRRVIIIKKNYQNIKLTANNSQSVNSNQIQTNFISLVEIYMKAQVLTIKKIK